MRNIKFKVDRISLLGFLFFIGIIRILIIGRGAASTPDESRYWHGFKGSYEIAQGNFNEGISDFFELNGRPFLPLLHLPQYIIQAVIQWIFDLDPRSVQSLYVVQFWNVLLSLVLLYFFYKVLKQWVGVGHIDALLFTGLFASFLDANLFLRHLVPYDCVLLFWFILFNFLRNLNSRIVGIGITGITLMYPGNWPISIMAFLLSINYFIVQNNCVSRVRCLLELVMGLSLPVVLISFVCYLLGIPFAEDISQAANNYLYELSMPYVGILESLVKYYFIQDGYIGILVLSSGILGIVIVLFKCFKSESHDDLSVVAISILLALFVYIIVGNWSNQKMLYGRMIKMFSPFFVVFSCLVYFKYAQTRMKIWLQYSIGVLILIKLVNQVFELNQIYYPRDLLHEYSASEKSIGFVYNLLEENCLNRTNEFKATYCFTVPPNSFTSNSNQHLLFVNFAIPDHINPHWESSPTFLDHKLIFAGMHYYAYPPYTLDWIPKVQMDEEQKLLQLKIYEQKAN